MNTRPGVAIVTAIYRGFAPDHLDWIGDVVDELAEGIDRLAHAGPWTPADDEALGDLVERVAGTVRAGMRLAVEGVRANRGRRRKVAS